MSAVALGAWHGSRDGDGHGDGGATDDDDDGEVPTNFLDEGDSLDVGDSADDSVTMKRQRCERDWLLMDETFHTRCRSFFIFLHFFINQCLSSIPQVTHLPTSGNSVRLT